MKVSDLIDFAVKGSLLTLNVADIASDNPKRPENIASMITWINLGLLELHKKFVLKRGKEIITDVTDGVETTLPDDFMYIINVVGNDDLFTPIPLNDEIKVSLSLNQTSSFVFELYKTIDAPTDITEMTIFYARSPTIIRKDSETMPVNDQFTTALLNWMAYQASIPSDEVVQDTNNTYYQRFQAACNVLTDRGLITAPTIQNNHLAEQGYV